MFRLLHWVIIRSQIVSQRRLQCSMHIAHIIQRDLVDNVTIDNCQKKLVL
jgi:hypothetical protein